MKTLLIALRALVYMTGFILFFGWAALRVRAFDRRLGIQLPAGMEIPGLILAVAGAILGLLSAGAFITRGRGTPAPFDAPREFVALGPYQFVRNPMYIGGLTLLVGFALYEHSISILFLSLALFFVVHLFVVFYEEPTLRKKFAAPYEEYCKSVSRWLPRRPRPAKNHGPQAF